VVAVTTEERKPNAIGTFFREALTEMRKVVWPSREETQRLTLVVIGVALSVGAVLALFDLAFTELVQLIR